MTLPHSVITAGENARDFCHVPRTNDFFMNLSFDCDQNPAIDCRLFTASQGPPSERTEPNPLSRRKDPALYSTQTRRHSRLSPSTINFIIY